MHNNALSYYKKNTFKSLSVLEIIIFSIKHPKKVNEEDFSAEISSA